MKKKPLQVKDLKHLKKLCLDEPVDFFVLLAGGYIRSSKSIMYDTEKNKFYILNYIDDSRQTLNDKSIHTRSIIGKALEKGAIYRY